MSRVTKQAKTLGRDAASYTGRLASLDDGKALNAHDKIRMTIAHLENFEEALVNIVARNYVYLML